MKSMMIKCEKGLPDLLEKLFERVSNDYSEFYFKHPGFSSVKPMSNGWNKIPGKLLNKPMITILEQMFTKKKCRKIY